MMSLGGAPPKPRILCLHGGGTSAHIFSIQTIRLRRLLPAFEFVFVSGAFESAPGPGVLPYFEGMEPFFRWRAAAGAARVPATAPELDEARRQDALVDALLEDVLAGARQAVGLTAERMLVSGEAHAQVVGLASSDDEEEGARAPFVGLLAFSQGAGVATRLLLRQEERRRRAPTPGEGQEGAAERFPPLKFAVLVGGSPQCLYSKSMPPPKALAGMDLGEVRTANEIDGDGCLNGPAEGKTRCASGQQDLSASPKVSTASIHVHGLSDQYLPNARTLLKDFFDPSTAQLLEFEGGHHMPILLKDSQRLADMITQAAQ